MVIEGYVRKITLSCSKATHTGSKYQPARPEYKVQWFLLLLMIFSWSMNVLNPPKILSFSSFSQMYSVSTHQIAQKKLKQSNIYPKPQIFTQALLVLFMTFRISAYKVWQLKVFCSHYQPPWPSCLPTVSPTPHHPVQVLVNSIQHRLNVPE